METSDIEQHEALWKEANELKKAVGIEKVGDAILLMILDELLSQKE